jgi:methionyl-tRNA formyltransferase
MKLDITILCSDRTHKIFPYLEKWENTNLKNHKIKLITSSKDIEYGTILFLISCTEIINKDIRNKFKKTLVIHESDLPNGKGWSPIVWQIIEGSNLIPITLLEAEDKVDSGAIWEKRFVKLEGHETYDEINSKIFPEKIKLLDFAIEHFNDINPIPQNDSESTYFQKRTPKDSEINVKKPISEQFDLLRIADPERYPCFFKFRDYKYKIVIEKINDDIV